MKDSAVDPAERWLFSSTEIIRNKRRTRTRLTPDRRQIVLFELDVPQQRFPGWQRNN
jgi:hypothetical protein